MRDWEPVAATLHSCGDTLHALAQAIRSQQDSRPDPLPKPETDRLLMVDEVAAALGVSKRWVYDHASRLPFTRRLSRRAVRFSEAGLRRWVERAR